MVIFKNATEYMQEFNNIIADSYRELRKKENIIHNKYRESLDNATGMEWKTLQKQHDKEISDITYEYGMKPLIEFERSQPDKPIFIFKANRKYYKLKIDWSSLEYTKLKKPITNIRLLRKHKPGWIIEYTFSKAFDFVICPNCQREFTRHNPHETYCHFCRRFKNPKKPRSCQNPGCEKIIPGSKNKRAKYCCGACRTAAFKKRKIITSSEVQKSF